MKQYLTKLAANAAGIALFLVACTAAALGLWVVLLLGLFGFAMFGLALLAAPLLALVQPAQTEATAKATA